MLRELLDKADTQAIIALMLTVGVLLMAGLRIPIPELVGAMALAAMGFFYGQKKVGE